MNPKEMGTELTSSPSCRRLESYQSQESNGRTDERANGRGRKGSEHHHGQKAGDNNNNNSNNNDQDMNGTKFAWSLYVFVSTQPPALPFLC